MAGTSSSLFLSPPLSLSTASKSSPFVTPRSFLPSSLPVRSFPVLRFTTRASSPAIETPETLEKLNPAPPSLPFRVGHGFDLHRLEPDLPLIIGGVNIPHDRGCEAHSDGKDRIFILFRVWVNGLIWVLMVTVEFKHF